jgi:hypothetical protein
MRYDPMESWANDPDVVIVVDRIATSNEEFVYDAYPDESGKVTYIAQSGPWISSYIHDPDKEEGYGGQVFEFTMSDGVVRKVKGPWTGIPDLEGLAGINQVNVTALLLTPDHYEGIWEKVFEYLEIMRNSNEPPFDSSDEERANWYRGLLTNDSRRARGRGMRQTYNEIKNRHHLAIYKSSAPSNYPSSYIPRPWEGEEDQITVVAMLASWFPPAGIGYSCDVEVGWMREQMAKHLPKHTLYRKRWDRTGLATPGTPDIYVPAPKTSLSSFLGSNIPLPKNEGWWGYAIHDEWGRPVGRFHEELGDLLNSEGWILHKNKTEKLHVSSRHNGQWRDLTHKQQVFVDKMSKNGV